MSKSTSIRAAGYCRTSGEGQRDNTSIPVQKAEIDRFVSSQNDWSFVGYYIDECKSGSQIEGRLEFQRMMRDAAKDEFDVLVVFDIKRYGRDGADIIESARALKRGFGVDVVDTKGAFDTRDLKRALTNFLWAGLAEQDRLDISDRTIRGRVERARQGKPWTRFPPVGRVYDKKTGQWGITDQGRAIKKVLLRYVAGESLTSLCRQFGIDYPARVFRWVSSGQLAGVYTVPFRSPGIGLDEDVPVPAIPEVIPQSLLEKVRARLNHNRTFNRTDVRKYNLTGFVRCGDCGQALGGQTQDGKVYYRHTAKKDGCTIKGVRGDCVEPAVLDHLYDTFLDEPAFNAAVTRAMPSPAHRDSLVKEQIESEKQVAKTENAIKRLVDAIADGADVSLLLSKQNELKAAKKSLMQRLRELEAEIASLPSAEYTQRAAMLTRQSLALEHQGKDWRNLPYEEVKRFLHHLFGQRTTGTKRGIFIRKDERGRLVATFNGELDFDHVIVDGRAISKAMQIAVAGFNSQLGRDYERAVQAADADYKQASGELGPFRDNSLSGCRKIVAGTPPSV